MMLFNERIVLAQALLSKYFIGSQLGCVESSLVALGGDINGVIDLIQRGVKPVMDTRWSQFNEFLNASGLKMVDMVSSRGKIQELDKKMQKPEILGGLAVVNSFPIAHTFAIFPKNQCSWEVQKRMSVGEYCLFDVNGSPFLSCNNSVEMVAARMAGGINEAIAIVARR